MASEARERRKEAIELHNVSNNLIHPTSLTEITFYYEEQRTEFKSACKVVCFMRHHNLDDPTVLTVKFLVSGLSEKTRVARLLFYLDRKNGKILTEAEKEVLDETELKYKVVEIIKDIGESDDDLCVQV